MDTNIPWIFGSSRLIVFIVLSDSVDLEFYMSLLEILCFFDLGSEDLGDETSAEWYLLIGLCIDVSGTLHITLLTFPIIIVKPIGFSTLINLYFLECF